jgi:hypothetical protein
VNPWLRYLQNKKFATSNNQSKEHGTPDKENAPKTPLKIGKHAGSDDITKTDNVATTVDPINTFSILNFKKADEQDHSRLVIDNENNIKEHNPLKIHFALSRKELEQTFSYYFLPNGYPNSVAPGYAKFTILFTVSMFCITLMSFISTQALFVALGSTMTKASLYSAAYIWVLKDGIGQMGAILFAGKYGSNFDEDIKRWRFICMILMNISIIIEMTTLRFPGAFIYLASLANVGKNVTFLCASATRANINLRFAKKNNIGDIAGKTVTQFTTASLIGIGVGLFVSKAFNIASIYTIFPLFSVLTLTNVLCSYYATKVVDEYYFNKQRFYILFKEFMRHNKVLNVEELNEKELFYLPAVFNHNEEMFCKFGQYSLTGKSLCFDSFRPD